MGTVEALQSIESDLDKYLALLERYQTKVDTAIAQGKACLKSKNESGLTQFQNLLSSHAVFPEDLRELQQLKANFLDLLRRFSQINSRSVGASQRAQQKPPLLSAGSPTPGESAFEAREAGASKKTASRRVRKGRHQAIPSFS